MSNDVFDFPVVREPVVVGGGVDMKHDALFRGDNGNPLGIVGRNYKLVKHERANMIAETVLASRGIDYEIGHTSVAGGGKRFLREFRLTGYAFTPASASGVKNTAVDGGSQDEYVPSLLVRNSYDRTSHVEFSFGAYRLVCSNGMIIGETIRRIKVRHNYAPDYEEIADEITFAIESSISRLEDSYARLNAEPASAYLYHVVSQVLTKRLVAEFLSTARGLVGVRDEKEAVSLNPKAFTASSELSAYALLQIVTEVISHRVRKYHRQAELQQATARVFGL